MNNKKKLAIVVSRFNEIVTRKLLDGAVDILERHNVDKNDIDIFWVPGCFEIPIIAKNIAMLKNHSAIICLGAVIRGQTPHFEYIASSSINGIMQVSLETNTPITLGILTTNNLEEALERAGGKMGNKGATAAINALELITLIDSIKDTHKVS